jgi:hypothetical protein
MANPLHIVVCAGIVPDPLQTLEPSTGRTGRGLKNEMVLPAVLDPWAASALYEAAPGREESRQQALAGLARSQGQAAAGDDDRGAEGRFELVPIDGPIGGFPDAHSTAAALADAIAAFPDSTASGCCSSAGGNRPRAARASRCSSLASGSASPTSFRAWTRSTCATMDRLKCWNAWKAASIR